MVHWLRFHASNAGACVWPLVRELTFYMTKKKKKTIKKKHVKKPIKKNVGGGSLFGKEVTTFYEVTKIGTSFLMLFCNPVSSTFPGLKPWQGSYTLKPSSRVVFNRTFPSVKSIPVSAHGEFCPLSKSGRQEEKAVSTVSISQQTTPPRFKCPLLRMYNFIMPCRWARED